MKVLFATLILAGGLFGLILSFDLLMGVDRKGIIWKAINPYRVMEPAEYVITLIFILSFAIQAFKAHMKNKKKSQTK